MGLVVVDAKDSTKLHLSEGNRRAHRLIAGALDYAEEASRPFGGVVVRRLGDGYLAAFPNLESAVAAALALQSGLDSWRRAVGAPPIELRAGVHAGRVLVDPTGPTPEVYGRPVERALALAEVSRGGDAALDKGMARHPSIPDAALLESRLPAGSAVLLRPRARKLRGAGAVQPELAQSRMVRAATLFAALADFSKNYEKKGRRASYASVKVFHAAVRAAVERAGGFVVKTEGETVMASFPSAAAAVRAGVEIQSRVAELRRAAPLGDLLDPRVGVSYGRALREERLEGPDFFGNTVNAAARLMRRAGPGEVLVSGSALTDPDAARALKDASRDALTVKGFDAPLPVLRLRPAPK